MDNAQSPPDAAQEMLHRLPYEATLTIMAPWRDGPEARAQGGRFWRAPSRIGQVWSTTRYGER